jgi:phage shock protein E
VFQRLMVPLCCLLALPALAADFANPLIDYSTFESGVAEVGRMRSQRRISEREFIKMSADPGTVVLDARSREKFDLLHVKGARHLSFPDITAEELAGIIPSKSTRILIYCNNNFVNEPQAFATKAPAASLNLHTINTLYAYGYRNVYELGPLLDVTRTRIPFEWRNAR